MVEDRTTDGVRIAQLLASELTGGGGHLAGVTVTDSDPDAEPTTDGALAYRVSAGNETAAADVDAEGDTVTDSEVDARGESDYFAEVDARGESDYFAEVFVHPDRVRIEFSAAPDAAADAGAEADLRVRPKAVRPPRTIVFVEDGAEVKRALPAFEAVVRAAREDGADRSGDADRGDDADE